MSPVSFHGLHLQGRATPPRAQTGSRSRALGQRGVGVRPHPSPGGPVLFPPHQHLEAESAPLHSISPDATLQMRVEDRASPRQPTREAGACSMCSRPRTEAQSPGSISWEPISPEQLRGPALERARGRQVGNQEGRSQPRQAAQSWRRAEPVGSPQHQGEHQGRGSELLVAARLSTAKLRQSYKCTGV